MAADRPPRNVTNLYDEHLRVHHLIDEQENTWNLDVLKEFIAEEDIPWVTSLHLSRTGCQDSYCWDFSKSGLYTVKSGYTVAHDLSRVLLYTEI